MTDLKLRSVVRGVGACLPKRILSNAELAERVNTSDEWIEQRTGIRQRHIAAEGQTTSHLGTRAAEMALAHAIGSAVEKAYRRGDLFDKRVWLMAEWAKFATTEPAEITGKLIALNRNR